MAPPRNTNSTVIESTIVDSPILEARPATLVLFFCHRYLKTSRVALSTINAFMSAVWAAKMAGDRCLSAQLSNRQRSRATRLPTKFVSVVNILSLKPDIFFQSMSVRRDSDVVRPANKRRCRLVARISRSVGGVGVCCPPL